MPRKYNYTKKTGRPTSYKPKYCQDIISFMLKGGQPVYKPTVVSDGNKEGSHIENHLVGYLPALFQDFAVSVGVCVDTLKEWRDKHSDFSSAYKKAKDIQLAFILKGAMTGALQQPAAIFALKNMHGWTDKREVEHSGTLRLEELVEASGAMDDLEPTGGRFANNGNGSHP